MLTATPVVPAGSPSTSAGNVTAPRALSPAPVVPPTPVETAMANLSYRRRPSPDQAPAYTPPSNGTTFAAAVLSGALAPTPRTLQELYARIGASDIPDNMQMRLKDLQA